MKTETIVQKHKENFETLRRAFLDDRVALLECTDKKTGEKVAVIVALNQEENEEIGFVPFAAFYNENPYERLEPPEKSTLSNK